jgi:riboflavin synthase
VFTGLVEDLGTVLSVDATREGVRVAISSPLAQELKEGDSVAVNGVCLTATGLCGGELFGADVMNETLRRSSLSELEAGSRVNLELPLKPDSRLGGHIVQGHVDGVGAVSAIADDGFARQVTIVAAFAVSLIPETLERTTLGATEEGAPVNLEVDIVAKYVEKLVGGNSHGD